MMSDQNRRSNGQFDFDDRGKNGVPALAEKLPQHPSPSSQTPKEAVEAAFNANYDETLARFHRTINKPPTTTITRETLAADLERTSNEANEANTRLSVEPTETNGQRLINALAHYGQAATRAREYFLTENPDATTSQLQAQQLSLMSENILGEHVPAEQFHFPDTLDAGQLTDREASLMQPLALECNDCDDLHIMMVDTPTGEQLEEENPNALAPYDNETNTLYNKGRCTKCESKRN